MFAAGTVLAGKYRVDRVLGQGGMGTVLAATHLTLGQPVALKLLLAEYLNNAPIVERFVREARASAALRGEHVCRVSDVGALEDGTPYIVMELLEGGDLASLVAAHGPLPVPVACEYVLQACVGVAEAHALSIVHRDLKPANLFLTQRPDGTPIVKVLDFGIAKAQGDTSFHLTRTASVMGSPGYMSPEQLRSSRDVDARSDIWSLGVILFELVTGGPPFRAESITELAIRVTVDPTPPLVGPVGGPTGGPVGGPVPQGFDEVVGRCLAKDPAHRYPDLAHLAHALAPYAGPGGWELANRVARMLTTPRLSTGGMVPLAAPRLSTGGMVPLAAPSTASPAHGAPTTMGSAASSVVTERAGRFRARWLVVAGAAIVTLGAAIGIAATRGGDRRGDRAAAPVAPAAPAAPAGSAPRPGAAPPDAAISAVAPPAADAALAVEPPDTAAETTAAKPGPPQQPAQPARSGKPPGGRPGKPPGKPTGEDFGESRY